MIPIKLYFVFVPHHSLSIIVPIIFHDLTLHDSAWENQIVAYYYIVYIYIPHTILIGL